MGGARGNIYSSICLLLFAIYITIESYRLGLGVLRMPGPGFFPFASGLLLGIISIGFLTKTLLEEKIPFTRDVSEEPLNWSSIILTLAAMLMYVAFFNFLGFVLTTFLLMIFLIYVVGKTRWSVAILAAILITAVSYLLFEVVLDAQLPKGILTMLFEF